MEANLQEQPAPQAHTSIFAYKPAWGPIGEQVFIRSYARQVEGANRKETWPETVVRTVDGNLGLVDPRFIEDGERAKLIKLLLPFDALPAGRHLSASGVMGRQFLFNCHAAGWDKNEPEAHFTFLFDELMQGGGVGANYSDRYMQDLPSFRRNVQLHITCSDGHPDYDSFKHLLSLPANVTDPIGFEVDPGLDYFVIPDTREGWVDSAGHALRAAWGITDFSTLVLDVSKLRRKGSMLKMSGGTAPGPLPLVVMLSELAVILKSIGGKRLDTLTAMAIDHRIAKCVVAGGKRRSSRMSVKSWKDEGIFEFIDYKKMDGENWTTNISVEIDDDFIAAFEAGDERAKKVLEAIVEGKRANGEPGIWNRSLSQQGEREPEEMYCPNPCGEIGLYQWENCNLGHVNLQHFAGKPLKHSVEAFRLMTRWLIRATNGDIPSQRQRAVVDKNRRIGVGFFGFHGWLALSGIRYSDCWKDEFVQKALSSFRAVVDEEATKYADALGIPRPVKTTTVAPTGSVALMPGVTTGLQPVFAPWFKRRVRYADTDEQLAIDAAKGCPIYPDEDAAQTQIVEYWCEDALVATVRGRGMNPAELVEAQDDIEFTDYLEVQAMVQDIYANNAISFTINIPETRMPNQATMVKALGKVLYRLKGTTVFPDKSRKNSPYERITKEEFEAYTGPKEISQTEDVCKGGCPTDQVAIT
jgi:ribonucleoside-triphosphate reductase